MIKVFERPKIGRNKNLFAQLKFYSYLCKTKLKTIFRNN